MEFLTDYGLFLTKTITLVVAIMIVAATLVVLASRDRSRSREQLLVTRINDRYRRMERTLRHALLGRKAVLADQKKEKRARKRAKPGELPRVFVMRFLGDLRASRTESLREEISAVLTMARPEQDRVVVCVESGGGLVHGYGLAASQLARLRERKIHLTVTVDKVAASGGYLMAAVADRIVAAPFAIVGSIGVVAQIPNFNRLLRRHDVDFELLTAGQYKRTLTVFGENTDEGRRKFQQDLEATHTLFKDYVRRYRPSLDLDKVATGEHWYGEQALSLNLVDELVTSDDLLMKLSQDADVFEVDFRKKQPMGKRLTIALENAVERVLRG
ncbi:MAG: protease SohB [Aquisalimonadaceae bacterium]